MMLVRALALLVPFSLAIWFLAGLVGGAFGIVGR